MQNRIFSFDDNAKAAKAAAYGYLNAIHYLAPASVAGAGNVCPNASPGCLALCLGWHSGHAAIGEVNNVRDSRVAKTAPTVMPCSRPVAMWRSFRRWRALQSISDSRRSMATSMTCVIWTGGRCRLAVAQGGESEG